MKVCIMHEQIMCHLRLFVNMNVYLFIYSVVHSILPRPCSARERFFSPTFWKGGRSEKSECLVVLKEFLPQMFPWGGGGGGGGGGGVFLTKEGGGGGGGI